MASFAGRDRKTLMLTRTRLRLTLNLTQGLKTGVELFPTALCLASVISKNKDSVQTWIHLRDRGNLSNQPSMFLSLRRNHSRLHSRRSASTPSPTYKCYYCRDSSLNNNNNKPHSRYIQNHHFLLSFCSLPSLPSGLHPPPN